MPPVTPNIDPPFVPPAKKGMGGYGGAEKRPAENRGEGYPPT